MSRRSVAAYLNDHLAGFVSALALLGGLEEAHTSRPLARFFADLRADIQADRREFLAIMGRLGVPARAVRKATGWLAGVLAAARLWLEDPPDRLLHLLESLEALSLGAERRRCLWQALAAADRPELLDTDLARLEQRALDQRQRTEAVRLPAAQAALAVPATKVTGAAGA